jgi:hypothetical protein
VPTHCACMIPLSIQGGQDCSRYEIKNITLNLEIWAVIIAASTKTDSIFGTKQNQA